MVKETKHFSTDLSRRYPNVKRLRIVGFLYWCTAVLLFFLLFLSRSGEVHTVWEVMHPAFLPIFFVATILLFVLVLSPERVEYKLLLIIVHSILCHIFFVVIFPGGYYDAQQLTLGQTRLVYDNVISDGIPLAPKTPLVQIYNWFRGVNFQTALSVMFARTLSIDIFWSHLFLVPLLWGTFVPIALFMVTKAIFKNKNVSVLSSLLFSLFPMSIIMGTMSIANSLGYIFFFCSVYFILKYLRSRGAKAPLFMVIFSFVCLASHPLSGIISFSLLLLSVTLKSYENEKAKSPIAAKISLVLSFLVSTSLLPFALSFQRIVYPIYTNFSLDKLYGLSTKEIVSALIFGEYVNFPFDTALVYGLGSAVGLVGMFYVLKRGVKQRYSEGHNVCVSFLLMGFLMVLVDHRILGFFMVNVPFDARRLWVFSDFLATPFVAFVVHSVLRFVQKTTTTQQVCIKEIFPSSKIRLASRYATTLVLIPILLSGWVTASLYYAYPHTGVLQTTSYELEAVKYIEAKTNENYTVICDWWLMHAGGMIVGINNPRAFYFASRDPEGIAYFNKMKMNASVDTMVEVMRETNNATVAYFIVEEPRLGTEEFTRVISQAQVNGLKVFGVFGDGKLYIYYYEKPA